MDISTTLVIAVALIGLTVFAGWRGARAPDLLKGPRMIPWRMIMVVSAAFALMVLVHLASLLGLHHDRY